MTEYVVKSGMYIRSTGEVDFDWGNREPDIIGKFYSPVTAQIVEGWLTVQLEEYIELNPLNHVDSVLRYCAACRPYTETVYSEEKESVKQKERFCFSAFHGLATLSVTKDYVKNFNPENSFATKDGTGFIRFTNNWVVAVEDLSAGSYDPFFMFWIVHPQIIKKLKLDWRSRVYPWCTQPENKPPEEKNITRIEDCRLDPVSFKWVRINDRKCIVQSLFGGRFTLLDDGWTIYDNQTGHEKNILGRCLVFRKDFQVFIEREFLDR